ncbi:hypothetical protein Scep_007196 [Stephania cephalantha]|uniref:Uncharacterized protein n=1 Tax=Stephania cephalantha TaxID=152367 RepID=A0AAP0KB32_9MAGN
MKTWESAPAQIPNLVGGAVGNAYMSRCEWRKQLLMTPCRWSRRAFLEAAQDADEGGVGVGVQVQGLLEGLLGGGGVADGDGGLGAPTCILRETRRVERRRRNRGKARFWLADLAVAAVIEQCGVVDDEEG